MEKSDKVFAKGIFARQPSEKAEQYGVKAELSFKLPDATTFLEEHPNNEGWVRLTVRESKQGKWYVELNTFTPKPKASDDDVASSIPF